MRLRLRGPAGSTTINLTESDTVGHLLELIREHTSVQSFDVRIGYPPQPLNLDRYATAAKVSGLDVDLDGAQLIVSPKEASPSRGASASTSTVGPGSTPSTSTSQAQQDFSAPAAPPLGAVSDSRQTSSGRKGNQAQDSDPPEIPVPERSATMVLRIMPDDNSCMFTAFSTAYMGSIGESMTELRSIIAQTIQADPETYSAVVLDQPSDEYCRWIQTESSWGGGIELSILSQHFDVEICSIDVQSLRVDRFNEGRPLRIILVYSGIHYDTIALSSSEPPHTQATSPPEVDIKVFDSGDTIVLDKARELARVLQGKHYFTDTAAFTVRCNICKEQFVGEKGAVEHAEKTGHYDFGEAAN